MKVLQVNAVYGVGSTGIIVEDIHKLSLSKGIESFVAYSTSLYSPEDIINGYKIGKKSGKKFHGLLCRINGMQGYFSRFSTLKFIKYIKEIKPDIVQLHNLHSNYINLNMLLKFLAKANIKTIVTLHDCWFYTGGCFHYTAVGCDRWKSQCGNCPKKRKDTPAFLFDRSAKILSDRKKYFGAIKNLTVVGVSDWISDEAKKTFFKNSNVLTIHNGIDTEIFKYSPSDLKKEYGIEDKFVILAPASKWLMSANKGIFEKLVSNLDDTMVLLLLGCTENQKENLPSNVFALPFIRDREELAKIYSMADAFVNCTKEESLSLLNVEPQACGTSVITFKNTGAKETVNNECSFSVSNDDIDDLLSKIRLIKEKGRTYFSTECEKWVKNNFDKNKNYEKYITLLCEVYN